MVQPIPRVRLAVQPRGLDENLLVGWIEIDVPNRCGFARLGVGNLDAGKERGNDEVDALAGDGEDAEHTEEDKCACPCQISLVVDL